MASGTPLIINWTLEDTLLRGDLQTQRLDTVFNDNSLVSSSKPVRNKREVKIGTVKLTPQSQKC